MTAPDRMPDEIIESLKAAGTEQIRVALTAHDKGVRDGMEFAAQLCAAVVETARGLPIIGDTEIAQIATAEFLRDHIRLSALQIRKPEVAS